MNEHNDEPWPGKSDPTALTTEQLDKAIGNLRELMEAKIAGVHDTLTERDQRYEDRFIASQLAVQAAFTAAEKAVEAALASAEKAINKAEVSIEKRADATYVAIGEMQRFLANLMPRSEAENRYSNIEKTSAMNATRLDRMEATKVGGNETKTAIYAFAGFLLTIVTLVGVLLAAGVFKQ